MTGPGRPRSERVTTANALRGMRRGLKTLLEFWEYPAKKFYPGIGWVTAPADEQPENNVARLHDLANNMTELAHLAQLLAQRANARAEEIRGGRNVSV